ncbi:hypothetical protein [Leptolinea tardivitalis]|uniref:4-vinyl reductase 4VR domain-containing protein n=1 Tax=Leptolinea tardivitalis TaxID=229920 RepID=A0A0P6WX17_9CHLR|nr:hypothetical protein [Leptolinea tardivitalis]KPL70681.1 hypothetical protein ADM99_16485 [Leptolinea tardivitalis]GAP22314.1 hypothetical protein LTAR_02545 [Leptolinea tardivitalis]
MKPIPASGLYYPNKFIRIFLLSLEDVAGQNGVKAILNMAGQSNLIGNYPPDNMEGEFDFSHYSMINAALNDLYGSKGARILSLRAGNAVFSESIGDLGNVLDTNSESYQSKSLEEKIEFGLALVRSVISGKKETSIPRTEDGCFLYSVQHCPVCWGRTTSAPECFLTAGLLQAVVRWSTNGLDFPVTQVKAHSCGDATCDYVISTTPINAAEK